jgi:hypothetical protein
MSTQAIEQIEVLKDIVEEKWEQWVEQGTMFEDVHFRESEIQHVISIGTSIMQTKFKVGFPGGGFVQAVVDGDLFAAIGRADSTNVKAIKFYVMLMYNVGYPF